MTLFLEWNDWSDSKRMIEFFNHEARIADLEAALNFNLDNKIVRQNGKLFQHGDFQISAGYGGWYDYTQETEGK